MRQHEKTTIAETSRPAKILVVEDEPKMVAGLRDNFEFEGYEVITANDGGRSLALAAKETRPAGLVAQCTRWDDGGRAW